MDLNEIQRSGVEGDTEEWSRSRYRVVELKEIQRSGVEADTEEWSRSRYRGVYSRRKYRGV